MHPPPPTAPRPPRPGVDDGPSGPLATRPATTAPADAAWWAWAASGAMALSGHPGHAHPGPPAGLVRGVADRADALARASARAGRTVAVDGLALLGERAALAGLARQGRVSCGGGTRLLDAADGLVAVALTRPDDVALVPAWLEVDAVGPDPWATVAAAVERQPVARLVERAGLVGLAVAAPPAPARPGSAPHDAGPPPSVTTTDLGPARRREAGIEGALVVDLSSLWAGPLCSQLLAEAGARVVKVEATRRPDGARRGDARFFDLLNAGKASVALDLAHPDGVADLHRLVQAADVVIEASRPRALAHLGLDPTEVAATGGGPAVWLSITGYGRHGPDANRVAYGDVAAVAGGLLAPGPGGPCFYADAVADPLSGLVAAVAVLEALAGGRRRLVEVAMVGVAAALAGPPAPLPAGGAPTPAPPRARPEPRRAPALGADTTAVLGDLPGPRP